MIPYGRQDINDDDIEAVVDVLRSDFITQGPGVPAFEKAIKDYCGVNHAIAVNSGTSALHIACLALGVESGDLVWTSPNTFVASANCALYCGADVDFVDIDPRTYNLSVQCLTKKLAKAAKTGRLPKVVIPVHFSGQACDMAAIHALSLQYGFRIIEDASHAIGGRYLGEPIGNCMYSDITVFSFHPVKIITTAEGGMAVTNDQSLGKRLELLRTHGITRDVGEMVKKSVDPWYYEQIDLGFNYRLTDLQAALGMSQLKRLDQFVARRREVASRYLERMKDLPIELPFQNVDAQSAYHLYVVRLKNSQMKRTRREVLEAMRKEGIGVHVHYIPVYHQPYYAQRGFHSGYCPEAEKYYSEALSLPIYTRLKEDEQDHVIDVLRSVCSA